MEVFGQFGPDTLFVSQDPSAGPTENENTNLESATRKRPRFALAKAEPPALRVRGWVS